MSPKKPPASKAKRSKSKTRKLGSIYDLADQTGVAPSTISRVLNQRGRISEETRLRVLAAARAAGFKPRAAVRRSTVALIIDRMHYAVYGGFVSSMLSHLICEMAMYDIAAEIYTEDNASQLGTRFIDGVIALTWDTQTIKKLEALESVPVVLVNRQGSEGFSAVASDHFQGGLLIGQHLVKHGHKNIAAISEESDWGCQERLRGVKKSMESAGLNPDSLTLRLTEHQPVESIIRELMAQQTTGLFLAGEDLTIESMHVLTHTLGIDIPRELSVVGLEIARVSPFVQPPLTCVAQPFEKIAQQTLSLLVNHIETNSTKPQQIVIPNQLIERASVASPYPQA